MHNECRQLFKKDPFELLGCQNEKCKKINEMAPRSMNFLSEASRIHFQEVLEYMEALGIPYKINNILSATRNIAPRRSSLSPTLILMERKKMNTRFSLLVSATTASQRK
jgi:hypothetical protein